MTHRRRALALIAAFVASLVALVSAPGGASPVAAQEAPALAWAVNGFGTTAAETGGASATYRVLINGEAGAEPVEIGPSARVAIPGLVAGRSTSISFQNVSNGDTTQPVTIRPEATDTVDVVVHPTPDGSVATSTFANSPESGGSDVAVLFRHVGATGPVEFQVYSGGGESGLPLEPVGSPVTTSNGRQITYGETLARGTTYTAEARLPSGATSRIAFTAGGEAADSNQAIYLTGLNQLSGTLAGGESGPFLLPILATSNSGGEGGSAGLNVVNGYSPAATDGANTFTVLINGNPLGTEGGLTVDPGERIGVPQVVRGASVDVGFRRSGVDYSAGTVAIPAVGSVDVAVLSDDGGATTTAVFDNTATDAPSSGANVVMRNIAATTSADMSIVANGNENGTGGSLVGTPVTVANGAEAAYTPKLQAGVTLYQSQVEISGTAYRGEQFLVGSESGDSQVRAVYAIGSDLPPSGEASPVRDFVVRTGPSTQPLAIVNGYGPGATDGANTFAVIIDGVRVGGEGVAPRSRFVVPQDLERGTDVQVVIREYVSETAVGDLVTAATISIPTEGSVDLVVVPEADGSPSGQIFNNGLPPTNGTDLDLRHAAGVGTVDVTLLEGGGESGGALTVVAGPVELDPNSNLIGFATGLSSNLTYQLEVEFSNGTILTTPFTPGAESGGALQAAYLVGVGTGGTQTNATLLPAAIASGSGLSGVTPIDPGRYVDTRGSGETVDGLEQAGGAISGGTFREFQIAGRDGIPTDATAIVANFTAAGGAGRGYVTPYDCSGDVPTISLVNFEGSAPIANGSVVPLSDSGSVCVFVSTDVNVIIDVNGFVPPGASLTPIDTSRLVDTRPTGVTVDGLEQAGGQIAAGTFEEFQIAGRAGIPNTASAVVANFTTARGADRGYITPYPCGGEVPTISLVNYPGPAPIANASVVPLSETGTVCVFSNRDVDVIIDVSAYVPSETGVVPLAPARFADTRPGATTFDGLGSGGGPLAAGDVVEVQVTGRNEIPASATAVIANFTAAAGQDRGFITPYPCDGERPLVSLVNYEGVEPIANASIVPLSATGSVCAYVSTPVQVIVDVSGYLVPPTVGG